MKRLLYVLTGIIGIFIIGLFILFFSIDGMIKSNIEEMGSEMLNTQVEVQDVSISVFDGTGTIEGITVQNPDGFSDSAAISLQKIHLKLDLTSLLSDTIMIDSIIINQPELFIEQKGKAINLKTLTENIDMSASSEGGMIIDYLLIEEGLVKLRTNIGRERSEQVKFEQFVLTDIGGTGNNTVEQTVHQILESILQQAIQRAMEEGLMEQARGKLLDILGL